MVTTDLLKADQELANWLRARRFGSVQIIAVNSVRTEDSEGDVALRLELTIPLGDRTTWPLADVRALELAVREKALELGVQWPWYVDFRPDVDEPQQEDTEPEPDSVAFDLGMQRPIRPRWLLRQAVELVGAGQGQPPNADLRRAASSAYYALFHAISLETVRVALPDASEEELLRATRLIAHASVRGICGYVSGNQPPMHVASIVQRLRNNTPVTTVASDFTTSTRSASKRTTITWPTSPSQTSWG